MHRCHVVTDKLILFFPAMPKSLPPVTQQTVTGAKQLSRISRTLKSDLCWSEGGPLLGSRLMVA